MRLSGRGVRCVRGGREVFSGLDFEAASGEVLAVIGPNGSGKTSLLRLIAGLLLPRRRRDRARRRRGRADAGRTGALSRPPRRAEAGAERDGKSRFLAGLSRRRASRTPAESLAAVGLDHAAHLPAAYLSAGQRRRLSLARLLTVRRPVWLLDEPTAALDVGGTKLFAGLMRDHLARGGLIVAATHGPLGIERGSCGSGAPRDRALRPDPPGHPDRAARRRRRADRRAVLSQRGGADAVRGRPRPAAAGAARPRDPLARRPAGEPAHPRPPVHGRP